MYGSTDNAGRYSRQGVVPQNVTTWNTDIRISVFPYLMIRQDLLPVAPTLTIVVANLKGGSTKTTSAAFVLHALQEAGLSAIGVDADGENESLLSWSEAGEWNIPVIGLPVADLHRKLPGIVDDRYDAVVIDTPPMKERLGVVASAIRLATHVLVPMAPTGIEYDRLSAIRSVVDDAAELRNGPPPELAVVFTRTVPNAASTDVYRQLITGDGMRVLGPTVGRLERYAQAYGLPIKNAATTAYGDIVAELLTASTEILTS
jgi:chromosome partitioning protein